MLAEVSATPTRAENYLAPETLAQLDDAWWTPVSVVPGEERARMSIIELSMPGGLSTPRAETPLLKHMNGLREVLGDSFFPSTRDRRAT